MTTSSEPPSPRAVFDTLVSCLAQGRWNEVTALYSDDVTVSNPFVQDGPSTSGRDGVEQFFGFLASRVAALHTEDVTVHETTDPEVVVAEFTMIGATEEGGFEIPAVFVLRIRNGRIIQSRDYMGPQRSR